MKMFISNKGSVYLEDPSGANASFANPEEYFKYTGRTAEVHEQLAYEPERDLYTVFDGVSIEVREIPDTELEAAIANVQLYAVRKKDRYYGATIEEAYAVKYSEAQGEAARRGCDAEKNPMVGVDLDDCYDAKADRLLVQEDLGNKKAGGIALETEEEDQAKAYQKLTEQLRKIREALGKGKTDIEKLDTVEEVKQFNVETEINWPVWAPPV